MYEYEYGAAINKSAQFKFRRAAQQQTEAATSNSYF
jgi:hypothetical protein